MSEPAALELPGTVTPASATADADAPAPERPRILFVDDDRLLLEGLRDALRSFRRRWSMTFVTSGEDALAAISEQPFDVVISDLRMPGMDGATLLERVRQLSPTAIRIVLSGHAELRVVARAAGVAHRLLAKPCETEQLVAVIEQACVIRQAIARVELNRAAVGASVLPPAPRLYLELSEALASGETSLEDVIEIIEQDLGMTAKVLQLANSAYFGRRQPVAAISQAVVYLGLEAVQALLLQEDSFRQLPLTRPLEHFDHNRLQRHCYRVGSLTRFLLGDPPANHGAFTAGLLHDIGVLVLATQDGDVLGRILAAAHEQNRPLHWVERELCQVTHAEVGAHLLALWGLPLRVTAAVAGHHQPPAGPRLDETGAVYLANILIEEVEARIQPAALPASELDLDAIACWGVAGELSRWRELAGALVESS